MLYITMQGGSMDILITLTWMKKHFSTHNTKVLDILYLALDNIGSFSEESIEIQHWFEKNSDWVNAVLRHNMPIENSRNGIKIPENGSIYEWKEWLVTIGRFAILLDMLNLAQEENNDELHTTISNFIREQKITGMHLIPIDVKLHSTQVVDVLDRFKHNDFKLHHYYSWHRNFEITDPAPSANM